MPEVLATHKDNAKNRLGPPRQLREEFERDPTLARVDVARGMGLNVVVCQPPPPLEEAAAAGAGEEEKVVGA